MPEGVEVCLFTEKLQKLVGCKIKSISILGGRYFRHSPPKGWELLQFPLTIKSIKNHGKFIYFTLNKGFLLFTLGMKGKFNIHNKPIKHDNIQFSTNCSNFYFNDYRNFGTIQYIIDPQILTNKLNKLGYDPLTQSITPSQFIAKLGQFKETLQLCDLLLEQGFASGVGNYLRADIMYCAGLHPKTEIGRLIPEQIEKLRKCISKIVRLSYKKQKSGNKYKFIIYKQTKSPKGNPVEHFKDKNGRTVWYVPAEQK